MDASTYGFDEDAEQASAAALAAHPRGRSLGRLRAAASWLAGCQANRVPAPLTDVHVVAVAGTEGGSDSSLLRLATEAAGARLTIVENWENDSARSASCEDALSPEEFDVAWKAGVDSADQQIDAGAEAVIPVSLHPASTTVAAAVVGAFTRTEPVAVVGPGIDPSVDDAAWKEKVALIRDAMFRARSRDVRSVPAKLLRTVGSADLVALTGVIFQAAQRRTAVLVDGFVATTAALMAAEMGTGEDDVRQWIFSTGLTAEPGHRIALRLLRKEPLLDLQLGPAIDIGALLALPLINTAIEEAAAVLRDGLPRTD